MRDGRGVDPEIKVEQDVKNEGSANRKSLHAVQKGSAEKIKGEISRRSARSVGKYREKQGKSEFRG